ncbi:MAG: 3-oxoacyl-[acyl-carrier-protein] synthase III C-terminal domain-containing protein, partial [Clostridium sp.]
AAEMKIKTPFSFDNSDEKKYIEMKGGEVFKFAVTILPEIVKELLDKANEDINNIKYIVPHQANLRIIDEAARRLKIDREKFYVNVDRYGNTSAASIPIALSELLDKKLINKGDKILLAAFGGGLTWAGALIKF